MNTIFYKFERGNNVSVVGKLRRASWMQRHVAAAGTGDMNDLLENPPFVGRLGDLQ